MFLSLSLILVSSVFTSFILLRFLIPYLRYRLLDKPNSRSSHLQPTPRGGGISFVLVSCSVCATAYFLPIFRTSVSFGLLCAPLFALPLALVGLLDDRFQLPSHFRYLAQLLTAVLMTRFSPLIISIGSFPILLFVLIFVTAIVNFTNFMDGLDGLVAGCMSIILAVSFIQLSAPIPLWSLVGALLGFLFWNWSPSNIFMGDVGSTFLGAVFACLLLQSTSFNQALGLLLLAFPLLGDAFVCVIRRFLHGQNVFQAHRLHLFQRLHQAGWSHAQVSFTYIAATAVLASALTLGGLSWVLLFSLLELFLGVWLDYRIALPFSKASCN